MRHHRAREPVRPEEHRLELPPDLVLAEALGGAVDGPPRVVDEHVDGHAVIPALELLDELGGAGRRVDVQREEAAAVGGVGLDLCDEGGGRAEGLRAVAKTVCEWARARRVRARPKPEEQPVMRKVSLGGSQDDIVSALQRSSRGVELRLELLVETSESSGSNLQRLAASIYTRRKRIRPAHASTNPGPRTPLLSHGELCVSL